MLSQYKGWKYALIAVVLGFGGWAIESPTVRTAVIYLGVVFSLYANYLIWFTKPKTTVTTGSEGAEEYLNKVKENDKKLTDLAFSYGSFKQQSVSHVVEHAPTPWKITEDSRALFTEIVDAQGAVVARFRDSTDVPRERQKCRRIVACVNALDQVSTGFLESATPRSVRVLIENTARMERLEQCLREVLLGIEYVNGDLSRLDGTDVAETIKRALGEQICD